MIETKRGDLGSVIVQGQNWQKTEQIQNGVISNLKARDVLTEFDACQLLQIGEAFMNPKVSEFSDLAWAAYEQMTRFIKQEAITNTPDFEQSLDEGVFRTAVFTAFQNMPYGMQQIPSLDGLDETESKEKLSTMLEALQTRTLARYGILRNWQDHPEEQINTAKELVGKRKDPYYLLCIETYGQIIRTKIKDPPPFPHVLDIGSGADNSEDGWGPAPRGITAEGYIMVGIDMANNKPESFINEPYIPIRLKLTPDMDLPEVLKRIGITHSFDVVFSANLTGNIGNAMHRSRVNPNQLAGAIDRWGNDLGAAVINFDDE